MTYNIDVTKAGLATAVKGFGLHALVAAALAGIADIVINLNNATISGHTAAVTVGFTLLASFLKQTIQWLGTKKDENEATLPVSTEFSGEIPAQA